MFRDFVYAYRLLKKSPLSTAVIVLALALGIGANTSMFVSVNSILLRPFPYPQLNRIVTVWVREIPKIGSPTLSSLLSMFLTSNILFLSSIGA
jgi:hypothetical protein